MGKPAAEAAPLLPVPDIRDDQIVILPSYTDSQRLASEIDAAITHLDPPVHPYQPERLCVRDYSNHYEHPLSHRISPSLMDADALCEYVENVLAHIPPRVCLRVSGSHLDSKYNSSTKNTENQRVTDFDITLSLQRYLGKLDDHRFHHAYPATDGDSVFRGGRLRTTRSETSQRDPETGVVDATAPTLRDWCHDFCDREALLKDFSVSRIVHGLDHDLLENEIKQIVRQTHYHGDIEVSFLLEHEQVDIHSPHWINHIRVSPLAWFFYLTFLWILTWPLLIFFTHRWSVYSVHWNWFAMHQDESRDHAYKEFASISEERWLQLHRNLLMLLVLEGFEGDGSNFPLDVPDERVARAVNGQ